MLDMLPPDDRVPQPDTTAVKRGESASSYNIGHISYSDSIRAAKKVLLLVIVILSDNIQTMKV